jgi:hypothetical protein
MSGMRQPHPRNVGSALGSSAFVTVLASLFLCMHACGGAHQHPDAAADSSAYSAQNQIITAGQVVTIAGETPPHYPPSAAAHAPGRTGAGMDCFDAEHLHRTWLMDDSAACWDAQDKRFKEGTIRDGKREGCWMLWYKDGLFDSSGSGVYVRGVKVESAPSPLGDYWPYRADRTRSIEIQRR